MKRNTILFFITALLILALPTCAIYFIVPSGRIELVSFESRHAKLIWHGRDGTELRISEIIVDNWGSYGNLHWFEREVGTQTVNDGETFTVDVWYFCVNVYYGLIKVTIDSEGSLSEGIA